jgi:NADP-dependent 3-hydroxy acid dehydrogenase YdfG
MRTRSGSKDPSTARERSHYPMLWCCLAVLPVMIEQQSGTIVNVGSQSTRGEDHASRFVLGR